MSPILTVVGATGAQGSSVVNSALKDGTYKVRAITRKVDSDKAKALAAKGVEVVAADLNDEESIVKAFEGSTAIYAVTDFFEPFAAGGPEHATKVEVAQGKNLANAAAKTTTLQHYIWSTLANGKKVSNGKYAVPHFEAKNQIDDYIKSNPVLLPKTTFLWVAFYTQNYLFPMFTPNFLKSSGKYLQLQPVPPTVPVISIGDPTKNVGIFTSAILAQPQLTLPGKFVLAHAEETTIGGMLETWSKATGKPSVYIQTTSLEEFDSAWPMWGREMGEMMQLWEELGDKSWSGEELIKREQLGIDPKSLVGVEETFKSMDWSIL